MRLKYIICIILIITCLLLLPGCTTASSEVKKESLKQYSIIFCDYCHGTSSNCSHTTAYTTFEYFQKTHNIISVNGFNCTTDSHFPHYHYCVVYEDSISSQESID